MLTGRGLLAWVLAVGLLSGTRISAQAGLSEPISGSPLRKAVLDGLRPEMEKTFGTEIQFVVKTIRVSPSWAFVEVEPRHKDGTAFDAKKIFGGDADHMDGMAVGAVLELVGATWQLREHAIGPTDVWWFNWCTKVPQGLISGCPSAERADQPQPVSASQPPSAAVTNTVRAAEVVRKSAAEPPQAVSFVLGPPPSAGYCQRLWKNETVRRYSQLAKQALELHAENNGGSRSVDGVRFDTRDEVIARWVQPRVTQIADARSKVDLINRCAYELRDSDLLMFFDASASGFDAIRQAFAQIGTAAACGSSLRGLGTRCSPPGRRVDAAGNLVDLRDVSVDSATIRNVVGQYEGVFDPSLGGFLSSGPNWSALFALFFDGGEQLLASAGREVIATQESGMTSAFTEKNRQAAIGAQLERDAQARALADERRAQEDKNRAAAAETMRAAADARRAEIRKGNMAVLTSCLELVAAQDATTYDEGFLALIQPSHKLKGGTGTLAEFTEDAADRTGNGIVQVASAFAEIRSSGTTKWFNKEAIHIGGRVVVVGVYTANDSRTTTAGAKVTVPVIDATCISPF